jgi:hypothetical protein
MGYSQVGQDQFVIEMLKGKSGGTYIEIGAFHSVDLSNTFMLEKDYGWTGLSFEIDPDRSKEFNANRKNKCYTVDARTFDYESLFDMLNLPKQIDYLQVDIEPATNTLMALLALPLEKYRFSVITFEHDLYASESNIDIKNKQKEVLFGLGYQLVKENVVCNSPDYPFEDWWIDPKVVTFVNSKPFTV